MTMTLTMSVPDHGDVTIEAEGVSDFATGDSRITIDQGALFGALDMSVPGSADDSLVEMRIVDGTAYVHYPAAMAQFMGGKSWISMSGNDELRSTSFGDRTLRTSRSAAVPRLSRHGLVGRRRSRLRTHR